MSSFSDNGDRDPTAPFLVRLFYRTGGFYKADEFAASSLPPFISVYTWPNCTLKDLALDLAASKPSALPYPAIGTRLAFQLVCPDLRNVGTVSSAPPRYAVKDLGSVVIGQSMQGIGETDIDVGGSTWGEQNSDKTSLSDARFVVGDYVSCAILPPLADGSVAPASAARREPNTSYRANRGNRDGGGGFHDRENGCIRPCGREGRGARRGGGGLGAVMPAGEWRRGERLPHVPPSRPRGSGSGSGRGRW